MGRHGRDDPTRLLEPRTRRLMPGARVELARGYPHQLLRLARLPFRHPGVV
jgi:hypothetical protein